MEVGIGVEHQQPAALELLQHQIQRPGFAATGIATAAQHSQLGMEGLEVGQALGGAVLAAIVDHPQAQLLRGPTQAKHPLHQPTDHRFLIAGGHHHIHGRRRPLQCGRGERRGPLRPQEHRAHRVNTQQSRQAKGRQQPADGAQPMGENSRHPTGQKEKGGLGAAAIVGAAASHAIDTTRATLKLCCRAMGRLLSLQAAGQASGPSIQAGAEPAKREPKRTLAAGDGAWNGVWQRSFPPRSAPALQG